MSKYNHECTYEACVKEFGDYPIGQYIKNKSLIWTITNIANELAEGNRLKRLELELIELYKYGQCNVEASRELDLEDRA